MTTNNRSRTIGSIDNSPRTDGFCCGLDKKAMQPNPNSAQPLRNSAPACPPPAKSDPPTLLLESIRTRTRPWVLLAHIRAAASTLEILGRAHRLPRLVFPRCPTRPCLFQAAEWVPRLEFLLGSFGLPASAAAPAVSGTRRLPLLSRPWPIVRPSVRYRHSLIEK